jgi:3-deoxy-D-manno-octulosonic-acid transferase
MTQIPEPLLKIGYNLLFTAGFALTWPYFTYLIWRRQPFWERLGERLGHYPKEVKEWLKRPDRPVWIHAVSVGEVLLARVLVRELRRHRPNLRVFLTVGTPTGRRVAEPLLDEKTCLVYVPTDFYYSMMRAFRRVNPRALILVENEIWPNMLWRAKKMGIPVCLVNSRLSRRNRRLFRAARTFVRPVLQAFDWIGVQSEEDLGRFAIAGFPENRLHLMGSMKYDVADLASDNPGQGREIRRLAGWDRGQVVLLGGSTHPGEEKALAELLKELKPKHPNLRLMLVPRHVERKGEILAELSGTDLKVGLRSRLEQETGADPDVLLVDSTGSSSEKPSRAKAAKTSSRRPGMVGPSWPVRTWRIFSRYGANSWRIRRSWSVRMPGIWARSWTGCWLPRPGGRSWGAGPRSASANTSGPGRATSRRC